LVEPFHSVGHDGVSARSAGFWGTFFAEDEDGRESFFEFFDDVHRFFVKRGIVVEFCEGLYSVAMEGSLEISCRPAGGGGKERAAVFP
jgi:hypothetical protein